MKVRIKKTGEIVNVRKGEFIELEYYNDSCSHVEVPLEDIELIPESTISYAEIERRKRIVELAERMFVSPVYIDKSFSECLIDSEKIIKQEEDYINKV